MNILSSYIPLPMENQIVKNVILAFFGSLIIAICAQITVPMFPVPMTLQTLAVLSLPIILGSRYGALAVVFYLIEGAMGLPVFAGGKFGFPVFMTPSSGYLFGFLIAAFVVGYLSEKGWNRSFPKTVVAMFAGNVILYIPGLLWLGTLMGWDKPILAWGLTPFIIGDLMKIAFGAALFSLIWKKVD